MATVVSIMDRDGWAANTDVIVLVDATRHRALWVPRDVYCSLVRHRINTTFRKGGHALLINALAEIGLRADHSICVLRAAVTQLLLQCEVTVPVKTLWRFDYPLEPMRPIEEGRKVVEFRPPQETLAGERIHQWIGARTAHGSYGGDLWRCRRQQIFLRRLLETGFDFSPILGEGINASSSHAIDAVKQMSARWKFTTLSCLEPVTIDGNAVLLKRSRPVYVWNKIRRGLTKAWSGLLPG